MYINLKMFKILTLTSVKIYYKFFLTSNALTDIVKKIKISGNERIANETIIMFAKIQSISDVNEDD